MSADLSTESRFYREKVEAPLKILGFHMIGDTILHYKILEKLGEGGMGVVYKAEDTKLKREVAIKFLPHNISADDDDRKRFQIEAQAAASLNHPNIAQIYAIEETTNTRGESEIFLVMEYIDGQELKKKIKEEPVTAEEAIEIASQITEGLEAAHKKGIIHRDIKSANIMITKDGNVKIMDFGLAKISDRSQITRDGSTVGTIAYMSPEQATGKDIDNRTDIWAFGVVLYELLTGHQPFAAQYEQAVIYSIINEPPTPITNYKENCPSSLVQIVEKCLAKNRDERYQKISDVKKDILVSQTDTDFGFRTKTLRIKKPGTKGFSTKKILTVAVSIVVIIGLEFLLPEVWQKIKDIAGWNSAPPEQHLVVLPLMNIGGDAGKQAFCEGLMETLSSNITQIEQFRNSLWVVPANEVIQDNIKSASEAFKKYGVNLAVTGSVQFIGNLLKLNLNLVDAKNLRQLNSSVIDVNSKEISSIDNRAVIKLLEMLHIELEPQLKNVLEAGKTTDPDAYEYYVRGIGNLLQYQNSSNIEEAIRLLNLAIQSDSNYALAYAGLGEAYWRYYDLSKNFSLVKFAQISADKGYALDSTLASTNVTLGMIYKGTGKYEDAVIHFKKALIREPSDAAAYRGLANAYQSMNRVADAEATYKQAIKLKPDYWAGYNDLGVFYYFQGRYDDAIKPFKEVIKYAPNNFIGYRNVGSMYYFLGKLSDAQAMFEKSIKVQPNYGAYSNLGTIYYKLGNFDKAAQMYQNALDINNNDYLMWSNLAAAQHFMQGKNKESQISYRKAIDLAEQQSKVNPKDPDVISNLAAFYGDIDDSSKAFGLLNKALEIAPDNSDVLFRAASINEHFKNRVKALYWIKKTLASGYSRSDIEDEPELKQLVADQRYKQIISELK
jgi:serine/threonine protein kinase/Tfp pilus assembly protein PilF